MILRSRDYSDLYLTKEAVEPNLYTATGKAGVWSKVFWPRPASFIPELHHMDNMGMNDTSKHRYHTFFKYWNKKTNWQKHDLKNTVLKVGYMRYLREGSAWVTHHAAPGFLTPRSYFDFFNAATYNNYTMHMF